MNTNFYRGDNDGALVVVEPKTINHYCDLMHDRSLYTMPLSPAYFAEYTRREKLVKEECDPQEVYCFEYNNYECMYTHDDSDVMKIILRIFGEEIARTIHRVDGFLDLDSIIKRTY